MLNLLHDTLHHCRFTLAILTHKSHLLATFDSKISTCENTMFAIRLTHIVRSHRIVTTAWCWWEFQSQRRCINLINLNNFEFFKHLHTALHLKCF